MVAASVDRQRRQLQQLYVELIARDGSPAVHRLLSAAIIDARKSAKPVHQPKRATKPKPKPPEEPTMQWQGQEIELGPVMMSLSKMRRCYVMHVVRDGLSSNDAARCAGYLGKSPSKSLRHCPRIQAAIAEVRKA